MSRRLKFSDAVREALDLCLSADPAVYLIGLGVSDPKGVFGTTLNLVDKYGPDRVMDMPTSENGMTGVAIGSALAGMRPVMTHQRVDFALLAVEQIVNQAAKWHYMFAGRMRVPIVIRMIVGRGWGQGPQHSQSLHAWFAHVPGLKVVMPATPADAKGLLVSSIEDDNPVIFFEHRWLHGVSGAVPEHLYRVPLGKARTARPGTDLTIAAVGHMTWEAMRAADTLARDGVSVEVIDIRTLRPLDEATIVESVRKTGRLIVADPGWTSVGFSSEIVARAAEQAFDALKCPPRRIALPDCPTPSCPSLSDEFYPRAVHIVDLARDMFGLVGASVPVGAPVDPLDVPDLSFTGPF